MKIYFFFICIFNGFVHAYYLNQEIRSVVAGYLCDISTKKDYLITVDGFLTIQDSEFTSKLTLCGYGQVILINVNIGALLIESDLVKIDKEKSSFKELSLQIPKDYPNPHQTYNAQPSSIRKRPRTDKLCGEGNDSSNDMEE